MWALVKKEIREHAVVCVAALALHSLLLGLVVLGQSGPDARGIAYLLRNLLPGLGATPPLVDGGLLSMLTVVGGLYGAALGLLQTLSESIRGTYPFLLHRPVSRSRVLLCKVAAALLLYLLAMLVPFAGFAWWASRPGAYAGPFEFEMTYSGVVSIGYGFLFYLGGLVTGLSSARWYATRAAGVVAPLCAAPLMSECSLPWAIVSLFLCALLMFWAALGTLEKRSF